MTACLLKFTMYLTNLPFFLLCPPNFFYLTLRHILPLHGKVQVLPFITTALQGARLTIHYPCVARCKSYHSWGVMQIGKSSQRLKEWQNYFFILSIASLYTSHCSLSTSPPRVIFVFKPFLSSHNRSGTILKHFFMVCRFSFTSEEFIASLTYNHAPHIIQIKLEIDLLPKRCLIVTKLTENVTNNLFLECFNYPICHSSWSAVMYFVSLIIQHNILYWKNHLSK